VVCSLPGFAAPLVLGKLALSRSLVRPLYHRAICYLLRSAVPRSDLGPRFHSHSATTDSGSGLPSRYLFATQPF
jgi:hypothetical protein